MFELTFLPGGMPPADPKRAGYRKTIPGPYPYKAFQPVNLQDVTIAYTAELAALIGDARAVLSALAVRYDGLSQEKKENSIPIVAASEVGRAQTEKLASRGCRTGHWSYQSPT